MSNISKLTLLIYFLLNLGGFYNLGAYSYSSISSPSTNSIKTSQDPFNVVAGGLTSIHVNLLNGTSSVQFQKIDNCSSVTSNSIKFVDDGLESNYYDAISRSDTAEICASKGRVILVFNSFDLATGDTLFVFQGNLDSLRKTELPSLDYGTGTGVSNAFGGWIDSNCQNKSGCLTFVFETNGDNLSKKGWESWWDCREINEILDCPEDKEISSSVLPGSTGIPILNGCNIDTMYYVDNPYQIDCGTYANFTRDWFVVDDFGNTYNCSQQLKVDRNISNIVLPFDIREGDCLDIEIINMNDLTLTGLPSIGGILLSTVEIKLGYILSFSDAILSNSEIKRSFFVVDYSCGIDLEPLYIGQQIIPRNIADHISLNCQIAISDEGQTHIGNGGINGSLKRYLKVGDCNNGVFTNSIRFTDDGGNDGDYIDIESRKDTVEICSQASDVNVVFTNFKLSNGDTLFVYQGDKSSLVKDNNPSLEFGTGIGVAQAFGGWINAHHDSTINASGCLTFIFNTNGDNVGSTGWDGYWDCSLNDQDNDNVPDINDLCANADDKVNSDGLGMPDACDCNPNDPNDEYIEIKNTLESNTILSGIYHASFELKSDGQFIENNTLSFYAGHSILLRPGFEISKGSTFNAKIDPDCSISSQNIIEENIYSKQQILHPLNISEPERIKSKIYPNPFNQSTSIQYYLPNDVYTSLIIYDAWGREVEVLQNGRLSKGYHTNTFIPKELQKGYFFMVLHTEKELITEKLIFLN